jgi:two-component system chemotaxis response regulator CheB
MVEPGRIYVAPPDLHMLLQENCIRLIRGPRENRHRPAIDPLFRSAAVTYAEAAVGIILTGLLDDGTAGLNAIKRNGGTAIVQDPKDALYTGMPVSAIESVAVDYVLPLPNIAEVIIRLVNEGSDQMPVGNYGQNEMDTMQFAEFDVSSIRKEPDGSPANLSCPDCHGTLWVNKEDNLVNFRCRTGHSYTPAYLIAAQAESSEGSLWDALRSLEEQAALFRQLAEGAQERKLSDTSVAHFIQSAEEKDKEALVIRAMLLKNKKFLEDKQKTG